MSSINTNLSTCFNDISPFSGGRLYKGIYNINNLILDVNVQSNNVKLIT